ncbi:MAG: ROK family protein, partial [Candidatus Omnitrophica bacterium]|nr:ROK family protein [Candidatus Omnitrophota bacterium]
KICSLAGSFAGHKIKAIGIGAPGIINIQEGFIYYLPNIPGWKNFPLKKILEKRLKIPVVIDNDANVFALAESCLGAGKGKTRSIFLTLGTGLGGAVVINGRLLQTSASAQELGHVPINLKGRLCGCGARGCIETEVGNKYLLKKYKQIKKNCPEGIEIKDLYHKALKGEREALKVWKDFSKALGKFLGGMINIFNPEVIIFGGGVSGAFNFFKPFVYKAIKEQAMWPNLKDLKLQKARLKDAGIIGAGLLARASCN